MLLQANLKKSDPLRMLVILSVCPSVFISNMNVLQRLITICEGGQIPGHVLRLYVEYLSEMVTSLLSVKIPIFVENLYETLQQQKNLIS